jgi:hypothetical protein
MNTSALRSRRRHSLPTARQRSRITPDHEKVARQIDLALVCQRFKFANFFMHSNHAGRIRFLIGHSKELQQLPGAFRRTRLTLTYRVETSKAGSEYRQSVELAGPFFSQTIEAVGRERRHSRSFGILWQWICPKCEDRTDVLLARIGQPFTCLDCHGRGADYVLPGTFTALPPEVC